MASFVLSFFPRDVLDEIWDLIESVSEEFLTYSWKFKMTGAYTKSSVTGVVIILINECEIFWEKNLRIIKDDIMFYGRGGSFEPLFLRWH